MMATTGEFWVNRNFRNWETARLFEFRRKMFSRMVQRIDADHVALAEKILTRIEIELEIRGEI